MTTVSRAVLSTDTRLCYRHGSLREIIREVTSETEYFWSRFTYRSFLADAVDPGYPGAERCDLEVVGQFYPREKM